MGFTPLCFVSVSATISGWYCVIMGDRSPMLELIPRTLSVYRVRSFLLWNGGMGSALDGSLFLLAW